MLFPSVPAWFKRLAKEWDKYGFPSFTKSMRQAEREIEEDMKMPNRKEEALKELDNFFTYHAPFGNQAETYGQLREAGRQMAIKICDACPDNRDRQIAIDKLRDVVFWANASIACAKKDDESSQTTIK